MPALFQFWPHRLMVRTPPFQGENPGSSPGGAAKIKRPPFGGRFILCVPGFEPGWVRAPGAYPRHTKTKFL